MLYKKSWPAHVSMYHKEVPVKQLARTQEEATRNWMRRETTADVRPLPLQGTVAVRRRHDADRKRFRRQLTSADQTFS